jgi:hypothetical protein
MTLVVICLLQAAGVTGAAVSTGDYHTSGPRPAWPAGALPCPHSGALQPLSTALRPTLHDSAARTWPGVSGCDDYTAPSCDTRNCSRAWTYTQIASLTDAAPSAPARCGGLALCGSVAPPVPSLAPAPSRPPPSPPAALLPAPRTCRADPGVSGGMWWNRHGVSAGTTSVCFRVQLHRAIDGQWGSLSFTVCKPLADGSAHRFNPAVTASTAYNVSLNSPRRRSAHANSAASMQVELHVCVYASCSVAMATWLASLYTRRRPTWRHIHRAGGFPLLRCRRLRAAVSWCQLPACQSIRRQSFSLACSHGGGTCVTATAKPPSMLDGTRPCTPLLLSTSCLVACRASVRRAARVQRSPSRWRCRIRGVVCWGWGCRG